jgi:hypothetical protein
MTEMSKPSWLLLLYSLPATHKTERVAVWRKLKKTGAIQIKTSAYLLPDAAPQYELFQWLAKQVRDYGGESTLIRAQEIEGLPDEKLISLFNTAREKQYAELISSVRRLGQRGKASRDERFAEELEKLKKEYRAIREVDFFNAPRGDDIANLLERVQSPARRRKIAGPKLHTKEFQHKTWLTRPRPEIDRVASAWLIRRFIDSNAVFVFASAASAFPKALPFDMPDAEFSHQGEDCTFETLVKRFALADKALRKIGEMVHDADLGDDKFQRPECVGIDRVLKGWAKAGMSDDELLLHGAACFDGLYSFLQRR